MKKNQSILLMPIIRGIKMKEKLRFFKNLPLYFLLTMFLVSPEVFAQESSISLNLKDVTIEEVLKEIKKQCDYDFIYDAELISKLPKVSLVLNNTTVEDVLSACLGGCNVGFKIDDMVIKLVPIKETSLQAAQSKQVAAFVVKGRVTDEQGNPLPGATILEDGTFNGVTTNDEGYYSISVNDANSLLRVSFIGFAVKIINTDGKSEINVVLEESLSDLGEVVVTGYSKISKERATGSFFQLKEEEIDKQVTTNIVDRLEGVTTGLLFTTTNGDGGNKTKITIRGANGFSADTEPLIVVDGFQYGGDLESINPNDIESINVLQDAAAASIWGVKSGAGVIVITTKSGASGKMEVEYSSYFTSETKPDLEDTQIASSTSLVDYISASILDNTDPNMNTYRPIFNAVELAYKAHGIEEAGENPWDPPTIVGINDEGERILNRLRNSDAFDDFSEHLLRNSFSHQHNISIRGGNERNKYYFSTSYNNDESVEVGDKNDRLSLLFNNDLNISKKLRLHTGLNVSFRNSKFNSVGLGIIHGMSREFQGLPRFQPLFNTDGSRASIPRTINGDAKQTYVDKGYLNWDWNPLDEMENNDYSTKSLTMRLNLGFTWDIFPFLSWDMKGQYVKSRYDGRNHTNIAHYSTRNEINQYTIQEDGKLLYQIPKGGILDRSFSESQIYDIRTQLNFDKTFADDHQLTGLMGMEVREVDSHSGFDRFYGYDDQTGIYNKQMDWKRLSKNVQQYNGSPWGRIDNPAFLSYFKSREVNTFMNMAYTYKSKYTLTVSGKIDQHSLFGATKQNRRNMLWSIGGAWNISQEQFFNVDFINILKLRASYGVNGYVPSNATSYTTYRIWQDYNTSEYAYVINKLGNPNIRHEDTYNLNTAIDFGLFNYRLSGSIEYYHKRSIDLIANFNVNPTYGFANQLLNQGEIWNSGIALNLSSLNVKAKDFEWRTVLNLTYNQNRVKNYENDEDFLPRLVAFTGSPNTSIAQYIIGEDISSIYAYKWAGLSDDGLPQIYDETDKVIGVDEVVENVEVLKIAGQLNPPVYGGLNNTFKYKKFGMTVLLTYKFGHVFRRPTHAHSGNSGDAFYNARFHKDVDLRWKKKGDEQHTDVARNLTKDEASNYNLLDNYFGWIEGGDHLVESASYIRVRQISIDYNLTKESLKKMKIPFQNVRFTAQVRNLGMLWTANKFDIDPDAVPLRGGARLIGEGNQMVISRPGFKPQPVYTFGINVQF